MCDGQGGKKTCVQIEVTPEMLREGAQILEDMYDALPSGAEETAHRVFLAMQHIMPECPLPPRNLP